MSGQDEKSPLVAVVVPVYNKEKSVRRTIESVLAQTISDLELVVVDDGSTDNSYNVALDACGSDRRAKVVSIPNGGVANARTTGVLEHTSAPYVLCLDSDDAIQPRFLEKLVPVLHNSPGIGIVYTTLVWINPDGSSGTSKWPSEFNPEGQFKGMNQIPTAALTKREVWERLGGQRGRYAPMGAGSEDAEFWLRACAFGFGAKFVPADRDSAFLYSQFSGMVSGNREYREVDWKAWHPWTKNRGLMPMFSVAPPLRMSHPARQYDEPSVSIIVPVGPGHIRHLANCLDSIEAQTVRKTEAVVVFDVGREEWAKERMAIQRVISSWPGFIYTTTAYKDNPQHLHELHDALDAYPYSEDLPVDFLSPPDSPCGPAVARNLAVKLARAPRIVFLDADDWLDPTAIDKMLAMHLQTGDVVYTDHLMIAPVEEKDIKSVAGTLQYYDKRARLAYMAQGVAEYDCPRAMRQPEPDKMPYVICNITTMFPKKWFWDVGGFDEQLESWEDVVFFWKLAWSGKCFSRIAEPLLVYRYHTGTMRERGLSNSRKILGQMKEVSDKWQRERGKMPCGCGKSAPKMKMGSVNVDGNGGVSVTKVKAYPRGEIEVLDKDLVLIEFHPHSRGDQLRFGPHDFGQGMRIQYGRKGGGERFYVHVKDVEEDNALAKKTGRHPQYVPVSVVDDIEESSDFEANEAIMAVPLPVEKEPDGGQDDGTTIGFAGFDWSVSEDESGEDGEAKELIADLDGLNPPQKKALLDAGIVTIWDAIEYDEEHDGGLSSIKGIGEKTREKILSLIEGAV